MGEGSISIRGGLQLASLQQSATHRIRHGLTPWVLAQASMNKPQHLVDDGFL